MELFKLFGTIAVDNSGANKAIDETTGKAEKSQSKFSNVLGKIGQGAVKIAKASAVVIGSVATGLTALTKSAVSSYADYEQLVGGVETLFKDSSAKVIEYANNAYKTAGLSANEYMSTVTSFSASLLQSLGGDTAKATESANLAITDMADNANKMGSSMESIQNAYQGFAKQNYTMLDNLKLGYGGTKEEMQRLLNDAEKLSGIKYDLSSFDDLVQAIHVVQTEMGITGTTAKEAATTIQGSIASMGGAWTNFLTGMTDPTQDFDKLLGNLIDSILTVADNIVPRLVQTVPRLIEGLSSVVQKLAPYVPELIEKLLPPMLEGATNLINTIVQNLPSLLETLLPVLVTSLGSIFLTLGQILPDLLQAALNIITLLASQISESLPEMIPVVVDIILQIVNTLLGNLDKLIEAAILIIVALTEGLINEIPVIIEKIPEIVMAIVTALIDNAPLLIEAAGRLISALVNGLIQGLGALVDAAVTLGTGIADTFSEKWESLKETTSEKFLAVKESMGTIMQAAKDTVSEKLQTIKSAYEEHGGGINGIAAAAMEGVKGYYTAGYTFIDNLTGGKLSEIANKFTSRMSDIKTTVSNVIGNIKELFSNGLNNTKSTVTNILTNIKDKFQNIFESVKNIVKNGIDKIRSFFHFSWELPKLKLPHFKISGEFSLNPLSVPHFGIDWYKKAMDEPMLMNQPTAFGINNLGQVMAGGEAGSEVVSGTDTLMSMISSAVASQNERMHEFMQTIIDILLQYMPELANMQLITDTGVLVGEIAPQIDTELGKIAKRKDRG